VFIVVVWHCGLDDAKGIGPVKSPAAKIPKNELFR